MPEVSRIAAATVAAVAGGASLGQVLPPSLATPALGPGQRAAVQDTVYGTLRWGVRLDAMLGQLLTQPDTAPALRALLQVGLYRLFYGRLPAHTAVNLLVEAAPPSRKGFVNAVLRTALRRREELEALADAATATRLAYPQWWVDALSTEYGDAVDALLAAGNQHPPFTLRVNRRRIPVDGYLAWLDDAGVAARHLGGEAVRLEKPVPVDDLPGFADGLVSVQDWAAQWSADLLDVRSGQRVLDACAAPGGKAAHIAERADVELVALEVDAIRLQRARETFERLGLQVDSRCADAARPDTWWDGKPFDRILADLPCSGSGVVRRHPDIKWLRQPGDIARFAAQQRQILDALWPLLAPGGRLLVVTCSIFPEENRQQALDFARRHADARPLALDHPALGDGQALPSPDHDGFFYAAFDKA
ncbi:MAG: 16S rRNA (cytosine(967)-C(5))-methyltransferase RsmB [Betaproteobacteria bacterium]|nr:16S rRNA (cytosine(967)-C(5))-methyltransferase RsmB [Betaproteobacteria bacterium]